MTPNTTETPEEFPVPEVMGAAEVAEHLGIRVQNIKGKSGPRGLPDPVQRLRATPVWLADEIRAYAKEHGYSAENPRRRIRPEGTKKT